MTNETNDTMTDPGTTEADRRAAAEEYGQATDPKVQQWIEDGKMHQPVARDPRTGRPGWWFVGNVLILASERHARKRLGT